MKKEIIEEAEKVVKKVKSVKKAEPKKEVKAVEEEKQVKKPIKKAIKKVEKAVEELPVEVKTKKEKKPSKSVAEALENAPVADEKEKGENVPSIFKETIEEGNYIYTKIAISSVEELREVFKKNCSFLHLFADEGQMRGKVEVLSNKPVILVGENYTQVIDMTVRGSEKYELASSIKSKALVNTNILELGNGLGSVPIAFYIRKEKAEK